MTRIGFGGNATPVATIEDISGLLIDSFVKHRSFVGAKTIGIIADAINCESLRKKREYLYFSVAAPGLVSIPKVGLISNLRKPAWNSMRLLASTISLLSMVLFILKCITDNLVSWGNKVEAIKGWLSLKWSVTWMSEGTSRTTFT